MDNPTRLMTRLVLTANTRIPKMNQEGEGGRGTQASVGSRAAGSHWQAREGEGERMHAAASNRTFAVSLQKQAHVAFGRLGEAAAAAAAAAITTHDESQ